jgi:hypothetical protein
MCASRTRAALSLAKVTGSQRPHARGDLQLLSTPSQSSGRPGAMVGSRPTEIAGLAFESETYW